MSETTSIADAFAIECVTAAERDLAARAYLDVCTGIGVLVATSKHCPGEIEGQCGGHPICRPCYELAVSRGLVDRREASK